MPLTGSEVELQKKIGRYLKAKIRESSITYSDLVHRLDAMGWQGETSQAIASKLTRGTFAATFFFAVLAALGKEEVRLEDLQT